MAGTYITEEIEKAVSELEEKLRQHPQRRLDLAWQAIRENKPRRYPVIYLARLVDISAGEGKITQDFSPDPEENLLRKLKSLTGPLKLFNPIAPVISTGVGPGTLSASFGLNLDAATGYVPGQTISLKEALKKGMPDPEKSGFLPAIKEEIETVKTLTPEWVKIGLPDTQGPFNLCHLIIGDEAFTAPYTMPERFQEFMSLVTEFFQQVNLKVRNWIGRERLAEKEMETIHIAECSVNLVSSDFYCQYLLPHDLTVAKKWKYVDIHTCSGMHVFTATLNCIPNLVATEAGYIEKACAGWTPVETALSQIGERPIALRIGEELPSDFQEAENYIKKRLLLARKNNRLSFAFTGMYWKKTDEPAIAKLHLTLDEFWEKEILPFSHEKTS